MKKILLPAFFLMLTNVFVLADEWQDSQVNNINRLSLHTDFFVFESEELAKEGDITKSSNYLSIEGNWKFHWVTNANERPENCWDMDFDDLQWGTVPVPGMWELNGYAAPVYVNPGYAWRGHFENNPPNVPLTNNYDSTNMSLKSFSWCMTSVLTHFPISSMQV